MCRVVSIGYMLLLWVLHMLILLMQIVPYLDFAYADEHTGHMSIQGDESFKCETCGEKTQASKQLRLYRLPQVLLLHIKRFKYSGSSREKLTNNVTFPVKVCCIQVTL